MLLGLPGTGMRTIELAKSLKMSLPSVRQSVPRGEKLSKECGWKLIEQEAYRTHCPAQSE